MGLQVMEIMETLGAPEPLGVPTSLDGPQYIEEPGGA